MTGLPKAIDKKVPIIMLTPPVNGPRTIPYTGAKQSATENVPERPIIGPIGIRRTTEYNAAKTAINAICFVEMWNFMFLLPNSLTFFASLCNFLHRTAIKEFPEKSHTNQATYIDR
jgi:hypothetical protein